MARAAVHAGLAGRPRSPASAQRSWRRIIQRRRPRPGPRRLQRMDSGRVQRLSGLERQRPLLRDRVAGRRADLFSSASIRGTIWLVQDRCDGSLTQVVEGTVAVQDTVRNKTVLLVSGGSSYVAKSPLELAPQTAALVGKRGLRFDGKLFKTKKAFDLYLRRTGYAWTEFARRYPTLATALAARR